MAKKPKRNLPIPNDLIEANAQIARIGELRRKIARAELAANDRIAAIKTALALEVDPLADGLSNEIAGLNEFADANRSTLVSGDGKSVSFGAGVIGWRNKPAKVHVGKGGDAALLAYLTVNRMWRYIRKIREPNKERILQDKPVIPNVTYPAGEDFYVDPNEELALNRIRGESAESEL